MSQGAQESPEREEYCTRFEYGWDGDGWHPLRCPECKGFLPGDFPLDEGVQFQCRRCGAVLEVIHDPPDPDLVEAWNERYSGILYEMGFMQVPPYEPGYGSARVCLVPDYAVKIKPVDYKALRKVFPPRRHVTDQWAYGLGFSRRIWRDKKGEFIIINGERLSIGDNRIQVISTGERKT